MLFEDIRDIQQAGSAEGDPVAQTWRLFRFRFDNTQSTESADDQYLDFEIVNHTAGEIDDTWTDADHQAVFDDLQQLVNAIAPYIASYLHCTRCDAYSRAFAPANLPYDPSKYYKHFVDSGPPVWAKDMLVTGGGSSASAPQVCTTVTEMVPDRKHWGRVYLPTIGSNWIGTNGRLNTTAVDAIVNAFETWYGALQDNEFPPVVVSTMANKRPSHVLMNVNAVRADDVLDIQRRRRYKHPTHIQQGPDAAAQQLPAPEE